jgi:hypothetical protein
VSGNINHIDDSRALSRNHTMGFAAADCSSGDSLVSQQKKKSQPKIEIA